MEFITQFKAALRVSTPLVAIRTFDAKSTVDSIRDALNGKLAETPMIVWDAVHGMRPLTECGKEQLLQITDGQDSLATVPLIETLRMAENCTQDAILFISNAHLHWTNDPAVIQAIWNLREGYKQNGNMLILLIAPGATLPAELVNDVLVMDEPLPTLEALEAIVNNTFKYAKLDNPDTDVLNKATDALIGLPAFPAEQSVAMCLDNKLGKLDVSELWERKRQIISQTPGLSVWSGPERLEDIGGIEQAKEFCKRVVTGRDAPKVILYMDEIEKAYAGTGTDMSGVKTELTGSQLSWMQDKDITGVIFIGLPGVSKSNLAKSLGGSYGIPVINFDLAGMQSSLVGSSGANLRAAQKTVDAISGGNVLAIATCNNIGALPPELLRRFNLGIFFFDVPSPTEQTAIWDIYRSKYDIPSDDPTPLHDGWTGAEIKECCKKAYRLRMTLKEAATYIVPVTKSSADMVQALRQSCSGKYLSASKPGVYMYSETQISPKAFPVVQDGRKIREMN